MNISILTVFPELYDAFTQTSLVKRARERDLISLDLRSFFSLVPAKQRIDAPTFGHGAGMLIKPEVVERGVDALEKAHGKAYKIFFSPHGKKLDQHVLKNIAAVLADYQQLMLIPARYEGMDARVEDHYADEIISVGDFVLMGGDIPAMLFLEGLLRLIPGVVGKQESVEEESFSGPFVDYPEYTEPVEWQGMRVPDVVRSGDHKAIRTWRKNQAVERTVHGHFDWLRAQQLTKEDKALAREAIPNHYIALMHSDVLVGSDRQPGMTSVTSLDIHDIARSARTYDIKGFSLVTPLIDQQRIVNHFLSFWHEGYGTEYNKNRHEAVKLVDVKDSLELVIEEIERKEGKKPILVATSAQKQEQNQQITFYDQAQVWAQKRPVLFVFGTGQGLSDALLARCDYTLMPVHGFSSFNHLSVRSAAAIVLDRWLGINEQYCENTLAD